MRASMNAFINRCSLSKLLHKTGECCRSCSWLVSWIFTILEFLNMLINHHLVCVILELVFSIVVDKAEFLVSLWSLCHSTNQWSWSKSFDNDILINNLFQTLLTQTLHQWTPKDVLFDEFGIFSFVLFFPKFIKSKFVEEKNFRALIKTNYPCLWACRYSVVTFMANNFTSWKLRYSNWIQHSVYAMGLDPHWAWCNYSNLFINKHNFIWLIILWLGKCQVLHQCLLIKPFEKWKVMQKIVDNEAVLLHIDVAIVFAGILLQLFQISLYGWLKLMH